MYRRAAWTLLWSATGEARAPKQLWQASGRRGSSTFHQRTRGPRRRWRPSRRCARRGTWSVISTLRSTLRGA
eukprot:8515992-Alexandrium_andersonii.AAC.1